jgi:hypothetical protein
LGLFDTFRRIFNATAGGPADNSLTGHPEDEFTQGDAPTARSVVKYPAVVEELAREFTAATTEELMARLDTALKNPAKLCRLDRLAEADAMVTVLCGRGVRGLDQTLERVAALSHSCGHGCSGSAASAGFLAQLSRKAGRTLLEKDMDTAGAFNQARKVDFLINSLREKIASGSTGDVEIELLSEFREDARDAMLRLVENRDENPAVREAALAVLEIEPDDEVQGSVIRALEAELKSRPPGAPEALAGFIGRIGSRPSVERLKKMLACAGEDSHRQLLISTLGGLYERDVINSGELREILSPFLTDPHPETAAVAENMLGLIDYEKFRRED